MEILIKASQFILSLSILVILHEFGHFIPAKLFKTRVEKFYLFFDPWFSLFKFKKGETEYGIGWLPLGGYVKIAGMIDESMDKEQLKKPAEEWEFRAKPTWQRLIIMVGGVTVNVLLAMLIYSMIAFTWGDKYLENAQLKDGIWVQDSLGFDMGFKNGDKIVALDGTKPDDFRKVFPDILLNEVKKVDVIRDGQPLTIVMGGHFAKSILKKRSMIITYRIPFCVDEVSDSSTAKAAGVLKGDQLTGINGSSFTYYDEYKTEIGKHKGDTISLSLLRNKKVMQLPVLVSKDGLIGVRPKFYSLDDLEHDNIYTIKTIHYGLLSSIPAGISRAATTLDDYVKQFKILLTPENEGYKQLGGFVTIGSLFAPTWEWQHFWELTAFLSIVLAFMNILPIPALDGGHVLFLLYEIIFRRKPNEKFLEYAQMAGMILLLMLMLYVIGNDIIRLFTK